MEEAFKNSIWIRFHNVGYCDRRRKHYDYYQDSRCKIIKETDEYMDFHYALDDPRRIYRCMKDGGRRVYQVINGGVVIDERGEMWSFPLDR